MEMKMKICIIGLGSIGRRHVKNLYEIFTEKSIKIYIDALRSSHLANSSDVEELIHKQYYSYTDLPNDYDVIFITNPSHLHFETLQAVIPKANHLFIEKPIFSSMNSNVKRLKLRKNSVYYVACPLRYTRIIQYLKEFLKNNQVYSVRCICSSYLPAWRPNTDYRQSYSANADMGGGVRIDLIHEWDYLQYLFGFPLEILEFHGTYSHLGINSDDTAIYIAKYSDKLISLHLDYYGRVSRREIELYLEDDVVVADLINQNIRFLKSGKIIELPQERDEMQKAELTYFWGIINGNNSNTNDIDSAYKTLCLTLGKV
jgi:predicted dehydrogenase